MVKRVIVPFGFQSMSNSILHILSFFVVLTIFPTSCYLSPQRESDTSEEGLKGMVKFVKSYQTKIEDDLTNGEDEFYEMEEYDRDGYLIKSFYICGEYDEYEYDWHGYPKETTFGHLPDFKKTYENTYDNKGRIVLTVSYEDNGGAQTVDSETSYTYDDQGNLASKEIIYHKDSTKLCYKYSYDDKNRKHEISCHISNKDTESNFVEKYDTVGNVLEFVDYNNTLKRCIYFYDSLGFLSEKRVFDIKDSIVKKELYRCDEHGNWIERRLIDKNGNFLEGELREIEYFD